jgi:hypothetical protein
LICRGALVRVPPLIDEQAFSQEETTFEEDDAPDEPSPVAGRRPQLHDPGGFAPFEERARSADDE